VIAKSTLASLAVMSVLFSRAALADEPNQIDASRVGSVSIVGGIANCMEGGKTTFVGRSKTFYLHDPAR
jgi:hypothetical protein